LNDTTNLKRKGFNPFWLLGSETNLACVANNIFGLDQKENMLKAKKEVNLREYAKYILKEGGTSEKRELMSCLKSRLVLAEKKLTLELEK